jgi:hypothetical protein
VEDQDRGTTTKIEVEVLRDFPHPKVVMSGATIAKVLDMWLIGALLRRKIPVMLMIKEAEAEVKLVSRTVLKG